MRSIIATTAFFIGLSSAAFAGGVDEDVPTTPSEEYIRQVEELPSFEVKGSKELGLDQAPALSPIEQRRGEQEYMLDEPTEEQDVLEQMGEPEPAEVEVAAVKPESECWQPFRWLAERLSGPCHLESNFRNTEGALPGSHTVTTQKTVTKDKRVGFKGYGASYRARAFARFVNKNSDRIAAYRGYDDVTAEVTKKGRKYAKVTVRFSKLVFSLKHKRGEGPQSETSTTSENSNFGDGRQNGRGDTPD